MPRDNLVFDDDDVVAIVDNQKAGSTFDLNGIQYTIIKETELSKYTFDRIIITPAGRIYDEIAVSLLENNICTENQIQCLIQYLYGKYVHNKIGVDIGGPSPIFYELYTYCNLCDIVNYAANTIWSNLKTEFLPESEKQGNIIINDATNLESISDETYEFDSF